MGLPQAVPASLAGLNLSNIKSVAEIENEQKMQAVSIKTRVILQLITDLNYPIIATYISRDLCSMC